MRVMRVVRVMTDESGVSAESKESGVSDESKESGVSRVSRVVIKEGDDS